VIAAMKIKAEAQRAVASLDFAGVLLGELLDEGPDVGVLLPVGVLPGVLPEGVLPVGAVGT
jgi:hypothetical protein